jgi:hypothetical protein
MNSVDTNDVLRRLLILHQRSLPVYLSYAAPWQIKSHPRAGAALDQIVADQLRTVDRLGTMLLDNNGTIDNGEFPMSFTSLHDLSTDYLISLCIERQKKLIVAIEKLAGLLDMAPFAQAAAREALGEAKGHLENLEELPAVAA